MPPRRIAPVRPKKVQKKPQDHMKTLELLLDMTNVEESLLEKIVKVPYSNGTYIVSIENAVLLYEIIGFIKKIEEEKEVGYEEILTFLEGITSNETLNKHNSFDHITWNGPWYKEEQKKYKISINRSKQQITARTGVFKCPVCLENKRDPLLTETVEIQTRSSDEPLTAFNKCNAEVCGHTWQV
jgi:DNA-directed RNA polymerase subunit M/transcription elongation factor TFIIS